jgi:NAD(P)-dependent dehydrogenase (short-subunit alcohol dehydrogenase family)
MEPRNARSVLVTGASSGIGRATVGELVRDGFRVFATVRAPKDAESLLGEFGGSFVVPVQLDVTDGASIAAARALVAERLGSRGLDGLVNNAGVGVTAPIEHIPLDVLRQQFEVNVFGPVAVIQAFLPLLRQARGRIINIGSVGGHITIPFGGALCASKHAFCAINDALRLELHPFDLDVVMIEPGGIHTPAVEKTLGDIDGILARLLPGGAARYGDMLREFVRRAYRRETQGSPPEVVARAVHHALTTPRPSARYAVGKDATRLMMMARLLPDAVLDRVRARLFGLPQHAPGEPSAPALQH